MICSKSAPHLTDSLRTISCQYIDFVIIPDNKVISPPSLYFVSVLELIFNCFFHLDGHKLADRFLEEVLNYAGLPELSIL